MNVAIIGGTGFVGQRLVQDLIEAGEIDTFTEAQLDSTGDDFQRISNDMGSAGGSCPAS